MAKKEENKKVRGVPIERQREADKLMSEIADVVNYIAEELVKIWELWGSVKGWYYFETTYSSITFMEEGCGGDRPSSPDYLFSDKQQWIREHVSLSEGDIADPDAFLSKHRKYRKKYDESIVNSEEEQRKKKNAERNRQYQALKREFGDNER